MGRLDPFSPQFQSMTLEKGAMVFHMLRWEMGDEAFHEVSARAADRSTRTRACARADLRDGRGGAVASCRLTAVLCAVAGWDGRAGVHEQVHGVPAGQQQGFPHGGVDRPGSGPVPDAGGAADRDGRQDGDAAGGCVGARSRGTRSRRLAGRGASRSTRRTGC